MAFTKKTLTSRAALNEELVKIRQLGYALDDEEREENLHCIGAPIFDHTGSVAAVLSVSWPSFRYGQQKEGTSIVRVKQAAADISAVLGHSEESSVRETVGL